MIPMTNGSRNERWLAAMMHGPSLGRCSRPIRVTRKYRWKKGCRIARTIQYTMGLTPRVRARSRYDLRPMLGVPVCAAVVTVRPTLMAFDRAQTLRGALAGAVAAGV